MADSLIGILGAGRSGIGCCKLALELGYNVLLSDIENDKEISISDFYNSRNNNLTIERGYHSDKLLNCDLIVVSPGIPLNIDIIQRALNNNINVIGEIEFSGRFTNSDILSITGSNGKSTTSMMLHFMLHEAGYNSLLGGNIGTPFSENLLKEFDLKSSSVIHVLELSSFQIEGLKDFNSKISCILNISEDHLDRYKDMDSYINAKLKIADFSNQIIYDSKDSILNHRMKALNNSTPINTDSSIYKIINDSIYRVDTNKFMFSLDDINFLGYHNLLNALNASTIASIYGVSDDCIVSSIKKIKPLSHRLEFVKTINGIKFYNDSKSTNLNSTITAINSFDSQIILILGGTNKGADFSLLKSSLNPVKKIYSYGECGSDILGKLKNDIDIEYIYNFKDCIRLAIKNSIPGDNILLSPGCASFDQFDNFEDRGDCFKKIVGSFNYV